MVLGVVVRYLTVVVAVLMGVETINAIMPILVTVVALEEHPAVEGVVGDSLAPLA